MRLSRVSIPYPAGDRKVCPPGPPLCLLPGAAGAGLARGRAVWYNGTMRQQIEQLLHAQEQARQTRQALERESPSAAWATADQHYRVATGRLDHAVREAIRQWGLVRELSRALAGTGYGVARVAFDADNSRLRVELDGGPETPAARRQAAAPATYDRLRTLADSFYSATAIEIDVPYDRLARGE